MIWKVGEHHLSFVRIPTPSRQQNKPAAFSPYSFEHGILAPAKGRPGGGVVESAKIPEINLPIYQKLY